MTQGANEGGDELTEFATPNGTLGRRVREVRGRRGWSARELARRCEKAGMSSLDRSTLTNIENGRRARIGIDEWLTLAYVLEVAPVHLLVPLSLDEPYTVTPKWATSSGRARQWIRGQFRLPNTDPRIFALEAPDREWEPPPDELDAQRHDDGARELRRRLLEDGYAEVTTYTHKASDEDEGGDSGERQ